MKQELNVACVERFAQRVRRHVIETIIKHGDGHGGPSLSCADILAVLYSSVMKHDPEHPKWAQRDRLILSAGHKCLALYGALVEAGYSSAGVLEQYNKLHSAVPGHPDMKKLCGVEFSTGSLGHGMSLGCGMALAVRKKGLKSRIFVLMGDGEQGEGSVWEAASFASAKGLDNLVGILDRNGLQINGTTKEVCDTSPLEERYRAFGWVVRVIDGHDVRALYEALTQAPFEPGRPTMIVCNTIKGKGLPFAEGNVKYHHWNPGPEEAQKALKALAEYEARWA